MHKTAGTHVRGFVLYTGSYMDAFICRVVENIVNPIILLLSAAAFVLFLYGLMRFIQTMSEGGDNKEGTRHMIWGIVGLAIIFCAYGIINFVITTFGIAPISPFCG